jgi:SAM-dependent methyltransferase
MKASPLPILARLCEKTFGSHATAAPVPRSQSRLADLKEYFSFFRPLKQIVQPAYGSSNDAPEKAGDDSMLVKRLAAAYRLADGEHDTCGNSMWQMFFDTYHKEIHHTFKTGALSEIASLLRDPSSSNLFYGYDHLCACFIKSYNSRASQRGTALTCLAGLIRICEAMGAIRFYNAEPHNYAEPPWETDKVIRLIEQELGMTLTFPNPYPNEPGLKTAHGLASHRAIAAVYQAWRIKELVKNISNPRVVEIGGGLGRTAYYSYKLGIKDYTLIDIPITSIAQGYFLGRTIGEDRVSFLGEDATAADPKIKILSPKNFLDNDDTYDLVVNVDSLTEIDPQVARAYWTRIEKSTGTFLSINHERNAFTVREFIRESPKVASVDRQNFWMRYGYVEELVRFKANL